MSTSHRWEGREIIHFGHPILGDEERAAVANVLSGHTLTRGPPTQATSAGAYTGRSTRVPGAQHQFDRCQTQRP